MSKDESFGVRSEANPLFSETEGGKPEELAEYYRKHEGPLLAPLDLPVETHGRSGVGPVCSDFGDVHLADNVEGVKLPVPTAEEEEAFEGVKEILGGGPWQRLFELD